MLFKSLTETLTRLRGQDSHIRIFTLTYKDTWTGSTKQVGVYINQGRIIITDYVSPELEAIIHQKLNPLLTAA